MVSEGEKTIDGLDGNGLLKTYALSMEDKMAAGAVGRARNYGCEGPIKYFVYRVRLPLSNFNCNESLNFREHNLT